MLLHGIGTTRDDFAELAPRLEEHFDVLNIDLPGHGDSPALATRPTVAALAAAVRTELDAQGLDQVHLLGNSLGARVALELARHGHARSVVALAPSGLGMAHERVYQGGLMAGARVVNRIRRPLIEPLSRTVAGRAALTAGLRALPWRTSQPEALAVRDGFADSPDFWATLHSAVLMDVPTGLGRIACPVILAQGGLDGVAAGQAVRFLGLVPGARFVVLPWAGHAPQSDMPSAIVKLVRRAADEAAARRGASSAGVDHVVVS